MLRALLGGKRQVKTQAVVDAPIAPADPDALRFKLSRPPPQLLRDIVSRYQNVTEDPEGYWLQPSHGSLPTDIDGTYFKNGPGQFELGGQKVYHPFDGHGIISSVSIRNGRAFYRSKFVRSHEYNLEESHGKFLYPASFGTPASDQVPGYIAPFLPKTASNTSVIPFRQGVLAAFESAQPHRLSASTLSTEGLDTLGGLLTAGVPFESGLGIMDWAAGSVLSRLAQAKCLPGGIALGGDALLVHVPYCAKTKRRVFTSFCISMAPAVAAKLTQQTLTDRLKALLPGQHTRFTFWEFNEEDQLVAKQDYNLPGYAFVHDIVVTPDYYILFRNPIELRQLEMLQGDLPPAGAIKFNAEEPLELQLIPRPREVHGSLQSRTLRECLAATKIGTTSASFVFHHGNAWLDEQTQTLHTDSVAYETFPSVFASTIPFDEFLLAVDYEVPISRLFRHSMHLPTGRITRRQLSPKAVEFPSCNPAYAGQKHRYLWMVTSHEPQQSLVKWDSQTETLDEWHQGDRYFMDEPSFVPRQNAESEDDGYILAYGYDASADRSDFLVFDASCLSKGPLTVFPLRHMLAAGIHGCWDSSYHGP